MKVLVCGGRDFEDAALVERVLDSFHKQRGLTGIIEGGARGADTLGRLYGERHGVPVTTFHAEWKRLGRAAGPIRNKRMLDEGKPDLVVAFPGGHGTANMIWQAKADGVEVVTG